MQTFLVHTAIKIIITGLHLNKKFNRSLAFNSDILLSSSGVAGSGEVPAVSPLPHPGVANSGRQSSPWKASVPGARSGDVTTAKRQFPPGLPRPCKGPLYNPRRGKDGSQGRNQGSRMRTEESERVEGKTRNQGDLKEMVTPEAKGQGMTTCRSVDVLESGL